MRLLRAIPLTLVVIAAACIVIWMMASEDLGHIVAANILLWALVPATIGAMHLLSDA